MKVDEYMDVSEGLDGDDFIRNKITVQVTYVIKHQYHHIICFKPNRSFWKENKTYRRRIWRIIAPLIKSKLEIITGGEIKIEINI